MGELTGKSGWLLKVALLRSLWKRCPLDCGQLWNLDLLLILSLSEGLDRRLLHLGHAELRPRHRRAH